MKTGFVVLLLLGACSRATGTPPPQPKAEQMSNPDVDLSWTMTKDASGKQLHIDYTLTNKTHETIYVADQLLAYHEGKIKLVPARVVVAADSQPGVIRFVRAVVETETSQFDHPPGAAALSAGAIHKGSADVELPLTGWHNYAPPPPLPARAKSAVLEIAYLRGPVDWGQVRTSDGKEVTIPQLPSYNRAAKIARSTPKPLP